MQRYFEHFQSILVFRTAYSSSLSWHLLRSLPAAYHVWTYVCYAQGTLVRDKCSPPSKDTIVGGDNLSGGRFEDDDGYDPLDYPDC